MVSAIGARHATAAEQPVLEADSAFVTVQDGEALFDEEWVVGEGTDAGPEVYVPLRSDQPKRVCFRAGHAERCFDTEPGATYDFVIALEGRRVSTRIDRATPADPTLRKGLRATHTGAAPPRLPFTLDARHGIRLQGGTLNGVPVDIAFDTGAKFVYVVRAKTDGKLKLVYDGSLNDVGSDGISRAATSSGNTLSIGELQWGNVNVVSSPIGESEVIVGWNVFETQLFELDYDRSELVLHENAQTIPDGYTRYPMRVINGSPFVEAEVVVGDRSFSEWFLFDSGFNSGLHLSARAMRAHQLTAGRQMGTLSSSAEAPIAVSELKVDRLRLGGQTFENIKASAAGEGAKEIPHDDLLGNGLLRGFNVVFDFQGHSIYLKPNGLFSTIAHPTPPAGPRVVGVASVLALLAALAWAWRARRGSSA